MSAVHLELTGRVAAITLNRPEKRNALGPELIGGLKEAFLTASSDPECRVIVLKAAGSVFCAGADLAYLKQLRNNTYEEQLMDSASLKELYLLIYGLNQVVIAQVEGHAIAGGCGLLTVCDLVYSVPAAKFGYTEVKIGFVPAIVAPFLNERIGAARSRELLLTGNLVTADTARQYGLLNFISAADSIAAHVGEMAASLATTTSAQSVAATKELLRTIQPLALSEAARLGAERNAASRMTDDFKKGITAFLEKKEITW